jgi:hypothetical protein
MNNNKLEMSNSPFKDKMFMPRVTSSHGHERCMTGFLGDAEGWYSIVVGIPLSEGYKSNSPSKHLHDARYSWLRLTLPRKTPDSPIEIGSRDHTPEPTMTRL